jgi:Response regulators consisting of a CheY-like receiver domain and a winged-helix DNA-binding domain
MKKILVVEDAQSLRKDILEMLGFEGFEAIGAENGLVGVDKALREMPDLIICDIMMPGLDGYGVLEQLRRDDRTAAIPFIFLTARNDRVDVRQGMELGADDYLTKPFTASELLATVHARLEKHAVLTEIAERRLDDLRGNIIMALPHELRTPLNVILGFSDLLMTDAQTMDSHRIVEMARHINNSAMRLYRLIENFITYAHTELMQTDQRQIELLRSGFTLMPNISIANHVLSKVRQYERESDLVLNIEEVEAIGISEEYVKKIIEELIDNACKFSLAGSPLEVTGSVQGDWYVLCIKDAGRGMSQEQINSVGAYMQFERRLYEQQGSGLGLVISKRLIELHGGQMTITSEPKQGTRVCAALPLRYGLLDERNHAGH